MNNLLESETRKQNRIKLTNYWKNRGVFIPENESIDYYIVVPGDKTDWAFYPFVQWLKQKLKHA